MGRIMIISDFNLEITNNREKAMFNVFYLRFTK